ncbi:hypothetical protein TNIN_84291 [Trichonephila inaurata madagascariensis]|uniref:Uncharacterized protein n=1 Tax=Trichonephila inaurata madagascariensis TaxID=2747483 RepID=A0A8X7C091_9ARAC|nr:hypothetical protein TNIN_84291 [Trichonephila inaurata madagascariensis]
MREKTPKKLEKAGKFEANNKKPSKKQKKKRPASSLSSNKEIPLDTSGDSFAKDNYDDLCAVYKGYFYAKKKGPRCDWIQCIKCNK